ncbi:hypothetical protein CRG98_041128 [Punica granatum]|uniref:Uncharacterized protein n=1 Tax=Punica granatum TaxID=22663 RepID=A0A2I0I3E1_PUNGR|nr:hypothetical protein CRG98_041128 [Punica granatum]
MRLEGGGSANLRCRKVSSHRLADPARKLNSHGLADLARSQEARARWLGELVVQESCKRHERGGSANLRCWKVSSHELEDPARLQKSKLARVSRPDKVARGTSEVARRTCGAGKKVSSHGLADPTRLQEARARWLGELAVLESKLARVRRPGKTRQGCKRHERGGSANLRCWKVSSHELEDPARLQKSKLARVSRPDKVARGTSEVARRTCGAGKKVSSHGLADPTRLQEARARWLGELAVLESCKRHERGGSANLRCWKVSSHELEDPARLQKSKLARVSRPDKVARGTSEVARRTCGAGK